MRIRASAKCPTQLSLRPPGLRSRPAIRQHIEGWVAGPVRQSSQPLRWDRPPDAVLPDQVVGQRSWWTIRSRASCTSHTVGNRTGSLFGSVPLTGRGDVVASERPYPHRRSTNDRGADTWPHVGPPPGRRQYRTRQPDQSHPQRGRRLPRLTIRLHPGHGLQPQGKNDRAIPRPHSVIPRPHLDRLICRGPLGR